MVSWLCHCAVINRQEWVVYVCCPLRDPPVDSPITSPSSLPVSTAPSLIMTSSTPPPATSSRPLSHLHHCQTGEFKEVKGVYIARVDVYQAMPLNNPQEMDLYDWSESGQNLLKNKHPTMAWFCSTADFKCKYNKQGRYSTCPKIPPPLKLTCTETVVAMVALRFKIQDSRFSFMQNFRSRRKCQRICYNHIYIFSFF